MLFFSRVFSSSPLRFLFFSVFSVFCLSSFFSWCESQFSSPLFLFVSFSSRRAHPLTLFFRCLFVYLYTLSFIKVLSTFLVFPFTVWFVKLCVFQFSLYFCLYFLPSLLLSYFFLSCYCIIFSSYHYFLSYLISLFIGGL